MFLPQGQEQDSFDANGQQTDDINSLTEWVNILLGYDKTADDEDDDSGNNFLLVKTCSSVYNQQQYQVILQPYFLTVKKKFKFPILQEDAFSSTTIEILTPPPDFII